MKAGERDPTWAFADPAAEEMCAEGNRLMLSGGAIGAASVASAVLLGATCPLCVVGVPAIIGFGIYQRLRGELLRRRVTSAGPVEGADDVEP